MCVCVCTVNTSIDVLKATRIVTHRKYVFVFSGYSPTLSPPPLSSHVRNFTYPFFFSTLRHHVEDEPEYNLKYIVFFKMFTWKVTSEKCKVVVRYSKDIFVIILEKQV